MAGDLIVDATLDTTNSDLKAIAQEFDTADKRSKELGPIWGQADIASAMNEFNDNWYAHRDKIKKRLGKLSERVDAACKAWTDAEKQLADSIRVEEASGA